MGRRGVWAVLVVVACGACAGSSAEIDDDVGVRIASFDFAESEVLAELYAQRLEAVRIPVVRLGVVGPREVVAPALELDRIDLVAEYLGTAQSFFAAAAGATGDEPAVIGTTTASRRTLGQLIEPRGLVVLEPAAAQNSNAIIMLAERAAAGAFVTIGDLRGAAGDLRLGGPTECPERPLCLIGLRDVYGVEFGEFVPMRSVELTAEALRRDEIDVGVAFTTSPVLDDDDLVVLEDDLHLQPPEHVVPVVRREAVERWGQRLVDALDSVSAALTTSDLRSMNRLVAAGRNAADVAESWLARSGLD